MEKTAVVTGPFGFTGRYITRILLDKGWRVQGLTGHMDRPDQFAGAVKMSPFEWDKPDRLAAKLRGADTLFNTYWVRFNRGPSTYARAVANVGSLVKAAEQAGVKRFVHISITNPDKDAVWEYFRGKAAMEESIVNSKLSYAILRPALLFGKEDVLFTNIAWMLRRFPVMAIPGRGEYKLRPVCVEDLAALAVEAAQSSANVIKDAVGPETYSYYEMVDLIRGAVKSRALLVRTPPLVALTLTKVIGLLTGDVVLERDELTELMNGRLSTSGPATCPTRLSTWLEENSNTIGRTYAHEIKRHFTD